MNNSTTLKAGTILRNTYRIESVLGQGGFGITYLAIHVRLKKQMAIKEFFPKTLCNRETDTSHVRTATDANSELVQKLRRKFLKEAEHIAKMDSPYIVKIIDVFEENQTAYYIMDFIEGRSLSDIVKNDGPLPVKQAMEYITKIGEALAYIHSKRMNHLDVKPANIMVRSKDNTPILIDFGLSKQYDSDGNQTSTTPIGLSHGFAPIEQYRDGGVKEFSPQTDLYSLAATLYYVLTEITPPQASELVEEELKFPPHFPKNLIKPIVVAMSSSRKRRHESIDAFLLELHNCWKENINPNTNEDTVFEEVINNKYSTLPQNIKRTATEDNKVFKIKESTIILSALAIIAIIALTIIIVNFSTSHSEDNNINNGHNPEVTHIEQENTYDVVPDSYTASFFTNPNNKGTKPSASKYMETKSGLRYVITEEGRGIRPSSQSKVSVRYKGSLVDGTVFDECVEPATFSLSSVIQGWSEGVQLMREGSKAVFYMPANLAYGDTGVSDIIPPNSPLIFEIQLIEVKN